MSARAERWHQVSELFDRVADLIPEERQRILEAECANDPDLRTEVERLLRADERTNPLDYDIAAQASTLLLEGDPREHEGQCFGPYRIVKLLGQGGMGRVYLAEREGGDFAQTVALKLLGGFGSFDVALARRRFLDERRMLARLQHPHIARLLDGGVGPEAQPWFAMEYVDGAPLTEWCDTRRLGVRERLTMFAKVCDAVDHAHRFLIVHRDIKPGNVLVDPGGEPKVLDFGIAKLLDEGAAARTGSTILMTPDYAAPEQMRGGQISTATDVYALGAVLFELLTGRKPFCDPLAPREPPLASRVATEGGSDSDTRARVRSSTPPALRKALRGDIDRILRTALDPEPARRYRSAARLAEDLRAVVAGQPISLRNDRAYRIGIFLRRHRLGVAAASIAILALLGTTGWALWQTRQTAEHARIATREAHTAVSVKNLVSGLLSSASPKVSLGKQLTVKEVLDNSRRTLPTTLSQEPVVAVELLTVMARSYTSLEDHTSARALLDRALKLAPRVDTERQAALQIARIELAMDQSDVVTMNAAADALRPLLPIVRDAGIRVDALLALVAAENHQYRATPAMAASALEAARAALPKSDARRVKAASTLAGWYLGSPEREIQKKAQVLLNDTLTDAQHYLPARHPDVMHLRELLAYAYSKQFDFAKSLVVFQGVLDDTIAVHGKDSVQVAIVESQMGQLETNRGDFHRARLHAERALRIFAANAATDPMDRSAAKMLMANAEEVHGNYAEAQRWYQGANDDFMSAASMHAKSMPFLQINVARMMARRGQSDAAAKIYQQVLDEARPGSLAQALAWTEQGALARDADDPARALALHRKAVELLGKKAKGSQRPYYHAAMLQLARDQHALKQAADSEATLAEIVQELDVRFSLAEPELSDAYLMLGRALSKRSGQQAEARRLLARCAELRGIVYGPDDPRTAEARVALTALG